MDDCDWASIVAAGGSHEVAPAGVTSTRNERNRSAAAVPRITSVSRAAWRNTGEVRIGAGGVAAISNVHEAGVESTWGSASRASTRKGGTASGRSRPTHASPPDQGDQGAESKEGENWNPSIRRN